MNIIVQGLLTNYQQTGEGQAILLLHGWGDRLETFDTLEPILSKNHKVISLDLPGFGKTDAPKDIWNLDNYAQFVTGFIQKIGVDVAVVAGHSNGGAVAIRGVSLGLLKPQKLVLLAGSGVRDGAKFRRFTIQLIAKVGKCLTFWLPKTTKQKLQKKLYGVVGSDMLVAPQLKETFKRTARQDIQADAQQITIPTLLIYGDQDRATPLEQVGQKLHKLITGSQLQIVPGADHFVHSAEPKLVAGYILEFIK